ncbi:MAG TPA: diguanylate cyclase [Gaiellaceae bacterium]|nr:diguanylate cyclase [Gaiellaceae bacterium]
MALPDVSADPAWPQGNGGVRQPDALVESYRRLAEVFHHVLSEQSLDTLLDRIADTLADLVPYDALQIYEADNARRELIPVLARSEWENEIMRTRPAFGQGITGWAVVNRKPVLANQAHLDPRVAFIPGTPAEPEALVSIPLIARGSLKGALNIYRLGETAAFDDDEFELAKWFGDAAALALDNAQVRARLEHQAQTDSLTGLYNHRSFHERLRAELMRASRARDSVALLMFDIDEFKRVNDICGHAVGDQILVALAETTASLVRTSDVVCRIGGEEFAVIMPSCDAGDGLGLARRLTERLYARPVDAAGEITISVGIAHGPANAGNPRDLVDCAESAMMAAKARGKNRIVVYAGDSGERPDGYDVAREVRSVAHLKMLQSVAARLNRLNSVKEISEAIVGELRGLIDYHSCRVYLVQGDEVVPVAIKGDGVTEEEQVQALRIKLGSGVTGYVADTGRSLLVANALECEHAIQIPGTEEVDESVIAVPLRYGSRVTGVVFLSKLGVNQFDESDLRLLEVLAGYASVSLENARLYESLRLEAEHARAWLEYADALSTASSRTQIAEEAVKATAALLHCELASLWLEDGSEGDFTCVACSGCEGDPIEEALRETRIPRLAAETLLEASAAPRLVEPVELRQLFRRSEAEKIGAAVVAPLPSGHGVRGWLAVARPAAGEGAFTGERLRLLEGLSYRTAMALQKARLTWHREQSLQVADALLGFARALARADTEDMEECVVRLAAETLGASEVSLWLQADAGADVVPVAAWAEDPARRALVLGARFPADVAAPFADLPEPFVLHPEQYAEIPGAAELGVGTDAAVAPFVLDSQRMGFLVAGARQGHTFGELQLKTLAGLADQATLAVAHKR